MLKIELLHKKTISVKLNGRINLYGILLFNFFIFLLSGFNRTDKNDCLNQKIPV